MVATRVKWRMEGPVDSRHHHKPGIRKLSGSSRWLVPFGEAGQHVIDEAARPRLRPPPEGTLAKPAPEVPASRSVGGRGEPRRSSSTASATQARQAKGASGATDSRATGLTRARPSAAPYSVTLPLPKLALTPGRAPLPLRRPHLVGRGPRPDKEYVLEHSVSLATPMRQSPSQRKFCRLRRCLLPLTCRDPAPPRGSPVVLHT